MIITDGVHLCSTESEQELHEFAAQMGLKRKWYQPQNGHPHYDLTTNRALNRAIASGAKAVTIREYITQVWWKKDKKP